MKGKKILSITILCILYVWEVATQEVIHIMPSIHAADTSSCLGDLDCYTLNEWIENGTTPFTNDTMVVLLPGLLDQAKPYSSHQMLVTHF